MKGKNRVRSIVAASWCIAFAFAAPVVSAQDTDDDQQDHPLSFLSPLMGTWVPAVSWLDEHPGMESLIMLQLQWGAGRRSIDYRAGLVTEAGEPFTEGTILWDPSARRASFVSNQSEDGLFFEGYYEPLENGDIRRVYTVHYPNRGPLDFRETFFFVAADTIDWLTEWRPENFWVPRRGDGTPEARAVRSPSTPSDALRSFERLVGSWSPDPERVPDEMAQERRENGVTDEVMAFELGSGGRWIELIQRRERGGSWSDAGSGLIAFDPYRRVVTYVEHTGSGRTLRGTLVVEDDRTFRRHYRSYDPAGTLTEWVDTWRWDDPADSCFEWTTVRVAESATVAQPAYWVCRRGASPNPTRPGEVIPPTP